MCTVRALNSISRALCRNHGLLTNASLLAAFNRHSSFGYCSKSDLQSKQELIYDLKKYPHLSENETHQLFDAFNRSLNEKLKLNSLSEECNPQTLDSLSAPLPITFNLAAYVDRSNTLKRLVDLGVDLYKVERSKEACEHILRLDFNKDIKPYISFLHDKGIPADKLGHFISEFPLVFSESTYNLQLRLDYLRSKHFTRNAIIKILTKHPRFLSKPIVDVDSSLGFVQNHFGFTGDEIRKITEKWPLIVEVPHQQLRVCHFSFKEEMGFEPKLMRKVMIKIPSVTVEDRKLMIQRFDFIHNELHFPHEMIAHFPRVLQCELRIMKSRHMYLEKLNRAQYDCKKPGYVPLMALTDEINDNKFVERYSKTNVIDFNTFLKTL